MKFITVTMFVPMLIYLHCAQGLLFVDKHESHIFLPNLGRITGLIKHYSDSPQNTYYQYKGIPFAESVERFTVAKPKLQWSGTHNGKIEGKVCPQPIGNVFYPGQMDEKNCLVLTVTTPTNPNSLTNRNRNHPVLVFFFGGAFLVGTTHTSWYNPERLVNEDIIVVQINYRLGAMGWLTDGSIIPKNLGLKDCRLGLEWVRNNIAHFGGDPNQVTIYGQSAGAIICDALWQSTRSQHLFNRIILQSGTLINPHSVQKNPKEAFRQTISTSICKHTYSASISAQVDCLKKIPDTLLLYSSAFSYVFVDTLQYGSVNGLVASVVVEDSQDPDAIVVRSPLEQLENGYFPTNKSIMISITSEERITFEFARTSLRGISNKGIVPAGMNAVNPEEVGKSIKAYYGGSQADFNNLPESVLIRASSDLIYNNGFRKFIDLVQPRLDHNVGIYGMQFSYASKIGRLNFNGRVGHVDDLFYIWGLEAVSAENFRRFIIPAKAYEKRNQIVKMIANFVKYGNPTPVKDSSLENIIWPKVSNLSQVDYLDFDTKLKVLQNPKNENYAFWMDLYYKKGRPTTTL